MPQTVVFTLKGVGHDVIEALDGQDAFSKARTKPADVVLTNLYRPNMDGLQLIRELRKLPQHQFMPMLLLTTELAGDRKTEGKAAGPRPVRFDGEGCRRECGGRITDGHAG